MTTNAFGPKILQQLVYEAFKNQKVLIKGDKELVLKDEH